jgi:predicted Fe-Mo cluster-binding NifX family protein
MRIAVAYDNGLIGAHFGHADTFAIYDFEDADVARCTKRLVPTGERHGHQDMADLMRDEKVDAVISGNMGGEAKAALLSLGIVPVAGFEGPADLAADLLVLGRLPINGADAGFEGGGSCNGSCSGCSGCGPDCDCGGSCGC